MKLLVASTKNLGTYSGIFSMLLNRLKVLFSRELFGDMKGFLPGTCGADTQCLRPWPAVQVLISMSSPLLPGTPVLNFHLPVQQRMHQGISISTVSWGTTFELMSCQTPNHRSRKLREHQGGKMQTTKKPTCRYIIFKIKKKKERKERLKKNTERSQRKIYYLTYKGMQLWITFDFSKTMYTRRKWSEIFKCWEEKSTNRVVCTWWNYPSKVKKK